MLGNENDIGVPLTAICSLLGRLIYQIFFKNTPPNKYLFPNLINKSRYMRQPENWFIT